MSTITFDTLKFVETLRSHEIPEVQAKGIAEAFRDAAGNAETASRRDLAETELRMKHEFELIKLEMRDLERRMVIKLGGMMMAAVALVAALVRLL